MERQQARNSADVMLMLKPFGVLHDVLGEGLRTFNAGSVLVGTENIESGLAESISDTAYQRRFRPNDDEVGLDVLGECHAATAGGFYH